MRTCTFESGSHFQHVEECAFPLCGLTYIVIPSSVEVLCKACFSGCKSLSSITLESGSHLQRIEEFAFCWSGLTSIVIPHSVEFIDGCAFAGLHLDFIDISTGKSRFRVRDLFLEDISGRSVVRYFGFCQSVVISSSVEVVCKSCFYRCKSLSSIPFKEDSALARIESRAFHKRSTFVIMSECSLRSFRALTNCQMVPPPNDDEKKEDE
jgi:hypothetical protein